MIKQHIIFPNVLNVVLFGYLLLIVVLVVTDVSITA